MKKLSRAKVSKARIQQNKDKAKAEEIYFSTEPVVFRKLNPENFVNSGDAYRLLYERIEQRVGKSATYWFEISRGSAITENMLWKHKDAKVYGSTPRVNKTHYDNTDTLYVGSSQHMSKRALQHLTSTNASVNGERGGLHIGSTLRLNEWYKGEVDLYIYPLKDVGKHGAQFLEELLKTNGTKFGRKEN